MKNKVFESYKNKIIEAYKQYRNCYTVAAKLCPAGATYQEWLAFYFKVIDTVKENNLI